MPDRRTTIDNREATQKDSGSSYGGITLELKIEN